ncbi:MAG: hypothetical protein BWX74_00129 [Tenericutes bacterium ADurb.Bin087]|nr:MAG: hypothetical protein BWX74_00129 [Tenericutes bacterium ADurb.Bin087]
MAQTKLTRGPKIIITVGALAIVTILSLSIVRIVKNNPPKNKDYAIYLYGEVHADKKINDKELALWDEFYHHKGMRHLFIEAAYFDAAIMNLWMQDEDDSRFEFLYEGWEGTLSYNKETRDFYFVFKERYPETIFHGTDVGHQHERAGAYYLDYLIENGMQDTEEYTLTLESIAQGEQFLQSADMKYRESKMVSNFIREFDALTDEKIMGIYGSAHLSKDFIAFFLGIEPMTIQLKKHYEPQGTLIYAKELDRL